MSRGKKRPFSGVHNGSNRPQPPRDTPPNMIPYAAPSTLISATTPTPTSISSSSIPQDTPRFIELAGRVDTKLLNTLTNDLKFDHMMPVQAATLDTLLQRVDCLAQAKTGTGKTIAFLLPAIQDMLQNRRRDDPISLLVLSPTRELAMQIAKEASALINRLQFRVQFCMGGTNKNTELNSILRGCEILVATPGRLLDQLSDPRIQARLGGLRTLVLDEADRMLDMGFLPDIKKILGYINQDAARPRHSMLFSATIAGDIQKVAHLVLKPGYKFISTIPAGEVNTHERVPQYLVVAPSMIDVAPAMLAAVEAEARGLPTFKAIVFAPTAALADFYGHILGMSRALPPVSILHSRKSQGKRTQTTQAFREATNAICVATDVIARGMDFPSVTHVFQVGLPADKESYIHRLGRTARADADGRGVLILSLPESAFIYQLKGIKIDQYPALEYDRANIKRMLPSLEGKDKIYQAWLGYYKTYLKTLKWSTEELVQQANAFALEGLQCPEVPGLQKKTIGLMGLKGVPGLIVRPNAPGTNDPSRRGGGSGRRG